MAEQKVDKLTWFIITVAFSVIVGIVAYVQQQNDIRIRGLEVRLQTLEQSYLLRGERIAKLETFSEQNVKDHAEIKEQLKEIQTMLNRLDKAMR